MRLAGAADHDWLVGHLRRHEVLSMFPLVNVLARGQAMKVWLAGDELHNDGMIGLSETGMVLPQWPGGDWAAAARALAGRDVSGLLGPADQVAGLCGALGLTGGLIRHQSDEPGYRLLLSDLTLPDCDGYRIGPIPDDLRAMVIGWRAEYEADLFASPPAAAAMKAARDVARWQETDSHRILWHHDVPVAVSGFNVHLPEVVQIGGVFVPQHLRGRGHARRVVGLHLAEARAEGVQRAVLFAASEAAERAYRALGFSAEGRMGLVLLHQPLELRR